MQAHHFAQAQQYLTITRERLEADKAECDDGGLRDPGRLRLADGGGFRRQHGVLPLIVGITALKRVRFRAAHAWGLRPTRLSARMSSIGPER
jgi:hypothetical protein